MLEKAGNRCAVQPALARTSLSAAITEPGDGVHDERRGETIELEGYVTAVAASDGGVAQLYLHAGEHTFRLELPIGPEHRLRVRGRLTAGDLLPLLYAERVELVDEPDRPRER